MATQIFAFQKLLHELKRLDEFYEADGVHLKPVRDSDHYALSTEFLDDPRMSRCRTDIEGSG